MTTTTVPPRTIPPAEPVQGHHTLVKPDRLPTTGSERIHDLGFAGVLLVVSGWLLIRSARREVQR